MNRSIWLLTSLIMMLLAVRCGISFPIRFSATTPEDAVTQYFKEDVQRRKAAVDWNSVKILQKQQVQESILFFLLSFQENNPEIGQIRCLYYYGTKQNGNGWNVQGSGGGCDSTGLRGSSPISAGQGSGWSRDPEILTFSSAEGFVFDDRVTGINVTWDDNLQQSAEVKNRSYLAVRLELHQVIKIEALDNNEQVIYTYIP